MKRLIPLFLLSCTILVCLAHDRAEIVVSYDQKTKFWQMDSLCLRQMLLLANPTKSKYFNNISLWADSLQSTPEGKKQYTRIWAAAAIKKAPDGHTYIDERSAPSKKEPMFVFSDLMNGTLRYYNRFSGEDIYYDEPLSEIEWQIVDSISNILGYECVEATATYHGRHWKVWFSPDIPLPFGPWKLRGLPGLILKGEADNGYSFTATGIEKSDREMTPIYSPENYKKVERTKALSDDDYYKSHRIEILKAKGLVRTNSDTWVNKVYDGFKYSYEPDYLKK